MVTSWKKHDAMTFLQKTIAILRWPGIGNFGDIMKITTTLIKTSS